MVQMLLKMTAVTAIYIILTIVLWKITKNKKMTPAWIIGIGIFYGICSILSTHFGIDYTNMLLNVRDIGPLAAGLFCRDLLGNRLLPPDRLFCFHLSGRFRFSIYEYLHF